MIVLKHSMSMIKVDCRKEKKEVRLWLCRVQNHPGTLRLRYGDTYGAGATVVLSTTPVPSADKNSSNKALQQQEVSIESE